MGRAATRAVADETAADVPRWLRIGAAWSWCLLALAALLYVAGQVAAPLAVFMFIAAFVPLVGVLIAGTAALLIVIAAKGLIAALILLGILIAMNQLEGHLLQPQVVGKMVRLHPLAVILVLAVAGVVAGIAGAVVAVPITAALTNAVRALNHDRVA